ncbi:Testis-specific serine/threonine-protein kinase 1 [Halotydeus destructor]|nr:Testis-specific serine/threonine-protein kinase 1 [Halotydeus destructor]
MVKDKPLSTKNNQANSNLVSITKVTKVTEATNQNRESDLGKNTNTEQIVDKDLDAGAEKQIILNDDTPEDYNLLDARFKSDKFTQTYNTTKDKDSGIIVKERGYEIGERLGKGAFGVVNKVRKMADNEAMAVKVIDIATDREKRISDLKNELFVLEMVSHRNIVKLFEHFIIDDKVYIFMEYCEGGDLSSFVRKKGPLSENRARRWFNQIARAVYHMHSLGIAHRDLKLQNVLLSKRTNEKTECKVSDFGLSRVSYKRQHGVIMCKTFSGTLIYMAPEIIDKDDNGRRYYNPLVADIWALGVCLYVMVNKAYPFSYYDADIILRHQKSKQFKFRKNKKFELSDNIKNLIGNMLEPDPSKRISFAGLFTHRWTEMKGSTTGEEEKTLTNKNPDAKD